MLSLLLSFLILKNKSKIDYVILLRFLHDLFFMVHAQHKFELSI